MQSSTGLRARALLPPPLLDLLVGRPEGEERGWGGGRGGVEKSEKCVLETS